MSTKIQTSFVILAFGAITNAYLPVTAAGFPIYQLSIRNTTNQDIQISFDGSTDNIFVGSSDSYFNIPFPNDVSFRDTFFIKATAAPASGQVSIQYTGCDQSATGGDWA